MSAEQSSLLRKDYEEIPSEIRPYQPPAASSSSQPPQDAPQRDGEDRGDEPRKRGLRTYILYGCMALAVVSQVMIWVKENELGKPENDDYGDQDQLATYALFLAITTVANAYSHMRKRYDILWMSVAVSFFVLDINICEAHWLMDHSTSTYGLLKAAYALLLISSILSLVTAMPREKVRLSDTSIFAAMVSVLAVVGSILIWSRESPCKIRMGGSSEGVKYPIFVGRAVYIALLQIMSTTWDEGKLLTFMYAAVSVSEYQPFGPRCDWAECKAGVWIVFICLIVLLIHSIVSYGDLNKPDLSRATSSHGILGLVCVGMCVVGAILVWSIKDCVYNCQGENCDCLLTQGQEAWDVFTLLLISVLMLFSNLCKNFHLVLLSLCLTWSVANRVLGVKENTNESDWSPAGTCPWLWPKTQGVHYHSDGWVRFGYILLLIGAFGSYLGAPVAHGRETLQRDLISSFALRDEKSIGLVTGIFILGCVAYIWSDSHYYGALGITALAHIFSTMQQFQLGRDFVLFTALIQITTFTPFTTCEDKSSISNNKLVVLLAAISLVILVVLSKKTDAHASMQASNFANSATRIPAGESWSAVHAAFAPPAAPPVADGEVVCYGTAGTSTMPEQRASVKGKTIDEAV